MPKCSDGKDESAKKVMFMLGATDKLEIVDRFCYLGDMLGKGGGAEEASRVRVRCSWGKFNELAQILTMRAAPLKMKGKIYKACVQRVLVYGSKTWAVKVYDMERLERTENSMVRWMCGVTVKDMIQTVELRKRLGIEGVSNVVRRGRFRWFGHMGRKENDDWVSACRELQVEGTRPRGRPRKTWNDCVPDDMRELGLIRED